MPGGREVCRLRQEYKLALRYEVKLLGPVAGGRDVCRLRQEYKLALQHEVKLCPKRVEVSSAKLAVWVYSAQEMLLCSAPSPSLFDTSTSQSVQAKSRCARSAPSRKEESAQKRYSHGRLAPALLLVALEILLWKMGEENPVKWLAKNNPPQPLKPLSEMT